MKKVSRLMILLFTVVFLTACSGEDAQSVAKTPKTDNQELVSDKNESEATGTALGGNNVIEEELNFEEFNTAVREKIWSEYKDKIYASDGSDTKKENNLIMDLVGCLGRAVDVTMHFGGINTELEYYIVSVALYMGEDGVILSSCTSSDAAWAKLEERIAAFNEYSSFDKLISAINGNKVIKDIVDYAIERAK